MTKYVVSSTLHNPEWNNTTVIDGDVVTEIRRLKQRPGQDIVQYGFGQLSYTLMEHGLLDDAKGERLKDRGRAGDPAGWS